MLKNKLTKSVAAIALIAPLCAFSLGDVAKVATGDTKTEAVKTDNTAVTKSGKELVASYVVAATSVLEGQKDLASAFELDSSITDIDNQLTALKSGNLTSSTIDKTVELSESTNKILKEKMGSQEELSAAAKEKVTSGLGKYALGVAGTTALGVKGKQFIQDSTKAISSAGLTEKAALLQDFSVATEVAKNVPTLAKDLVGTGKQFIDYATGLGVDTSAATKTMSSIAGF